MRRKLWDSLVELRHPAATAAVCRLGEDRTLLLVPDLDHQSGTPIEGFEPALHLGRVSALVGGLVAPGAVRAEALDRRGRAHAAVCANGVWIASVPEPSRFGDALVRFRDVAGKIVQRPLRAGATVTLLSTEVSRPCPACAARDWQIARWPWFADESARTDVYDFAAGVCRRCGHTEQLGAKRVGAKPHPDKPQAAEPPSIEELLRAAQFPMFGLAPSWRGRRCVQSWMAVERSLASVSLFHRPEGSRSAWLSVSSSTPDRGWSPIETAEHEFPGGGRPKRFRNRRRQEAEDQGNLDAQLRARQRERTAARAPHGEVAVKIGGRNVTFAIVGDARRWGAATQANGASIGLAGRNIEPRDLRLSRLKDLSAYTRGGRPPGRA